MDRMLQEFYCNNCCGFIQAKLNTSINIRVVLVCPNCGHEHHRHIVDGQLKDLYSGAHGEFKERILPPKSSYSKISIAAKQPVKNGRDGVKLMEENDYKDDFKEAYRRNYFRQRHFEAHGEI